MIEVTLIDADGIETVIVGKPGDTVMSLAVASGNDGIIGECGGSMMCATCHCYVDAAWAPVAGERSAGEEDMLESAAAEVKSSSRLSCQITLTPEMSGMIIHLPDAQS